MEIVVLTFVVLFLLVVVHVYTLNAIKNRMKQIKELEYQVQLESVHLERLKKQSKQLKVKELKDGVIKDGLA